MPDRPLPTTWARLINGVLERLREVERLAFLARSEVFQAVDQIEDSHTYTWQSARGLTTGLGLRYYTERDGNINFIRADRSSGDGTSTATLDVLKNGTSIFATAAKPTVLSGAFLGAEAIPDDAEFVKGDYFQVEIEATGGGTGPLRVTFAFTA